MLFVFLIDLLVAWVEHSAKQCSYIAADAVVDVDTNADGVDVVACGCCAVLSVWTNASGTRSLPTAHVGALPAYRIPSSLFLTSTTLIINNNG